MARRRLRISPTPMRSTQHGAFPRIQTGVPQQEVPQDCHHASRRRHAGRPNRPTAIEPRQAGWEQAGLQPRCQGRIADGPCRAASAVWRSADPPVGPYRLQPSVSGTRGAESGPAGSKWGFESLTENPNKGNATAGPAFRPLVPPKTESARTGRDTGGEAGGLDRDKG